jgi:hypothetical protein
MSARRVPRRKKDIKTEGAESKYGSVSDFGLDVTRINWF